MRARKQVRLISLGGTIASAPDSAGQDVVPRLTGSDILASVPGITDLADISTVQFRQVPSGDLRVEDLVGLADVVEEAAREADGVVITQGTDTLEESAYVLELLLRTDKPVVVTGAMRNAGLPGADGPANLRAAVQVACSPQAHGLGPVVVFADQVHLPRFVQKTHTSSVAAFASPGAGPIGWVIEDRVRVPLVPRFRHHVIDAALLRPSAPRVGLIRFGMGELPLDDVHVAGMSGLVVEVFGGGHVPARTVDSLQGINKTIPVVMASRTGAGELYERTYAMPGAERDLRGRGLIGAGALTGVKARLLLTMLLLSEADRNEIDEAFAAVSS